MINGTTKIIGVIGDPVEHSLSPAMFNAAFKSLKLNYIYVPFHVKKDDLNSAIAGAKAFDIKGLNITIPHKRKVLNEIDKFDVMANLIGAVNTIKFVDGKSYGYNTDCIGAVKAIEEFSDLKDKNVVIVGAGGAARAIAFQIAISKINNLTIINRSIKNAKSLIFDIETLLSEFKANSKLEDIVLDSTYIDLNFKHGGIDSLPMHLKNADILIDTTPVGMYPNEHVEPVATANDMHSDLIVNDIVYNPVETSLLREAKLANATTISGIKMLLYQGTENFKIWTGLEAPQDIMEKTLLDEINK